MVFEARFTSCFSSEEQLLLAAARISLDRESAIRVRTLASRIQDPSRLAQIAALHGVLPIVYRNLGAVCPELFPESLTRALLADFQKNAAHSLFLTAEMFHVQDLLNQEKVSSLPYKGPTLAALVYGNVALRQFADLDFLLHERDLPRARELLIRQNYRLAAPLTADQEAAYVADLGQLPLMRNDGKCLVELHTRLMPRGYRFRLDTEQVCSRTQSVVVEGRKVSTLAANDLLLVLCVHGAKHLWASLGWICDVAAFVSASPQLDWDAVLAESQRLRCERMLLLGLFLAEVLLGAALPTQLSAKATAVPAIESLTEHVCRRLFTRPPDDTGGWETCSFHFKAREYWPDRVRYAMYLALAPNLADWSALSLPRGLAPLYYLVRPLRLAGKYARRLLVSPR